MRHRLDVGIDQRHELAGGAFRIVDDEQAGMVERGEMRSRSSAMALPGPLLAPGGEEFGIALALGLDQPAQRPAVPIAHAIADQAMGEGSKFGLEAGGPLRKGRKQREEVGIRALGEFVERRRRNRVSLSP